MSRASTQLSEYTGSPIIESIFRLPENALLSYSSWIFLINDNGMPVTEH